jgi:hypothetical protein
MSIDSNDFYLPNAVEDVVSSRQRNVLSSFTTIDPVAVLRHHPSPQIQIIHLTPD